jgi:O-antigen chain-terminating methyltransferase
MADPPVIDVAALVEDLRGRVARARAEGGYADDLTGERLVAPAPAARVRFRPELAYSTKPVVGAPLTAVKKVLMRLTVHVFDDLARQADAGIAAAEGAAAEARAQAQAAMEAEAASRERVQEDVAGLLSRIEGLETALDRLQLPARLARLERRPRETASTAADPAPGAAPAPVAASDTGVDYLAFEARFRGSEDAVRGRQEVYRPTLAGCTRVVDLGCGRGELLEMLRDAGVGAYGVDTEPDFVELVAEKGLEIRREDAVAHVEGLAPGEVDGMVASHLVEHMPPAALARLVRAAAAVLEEGGVLILETPNPESLLAGSINFHRDPTHLRPVHPDTLAFLCESAGFAQVEIMRLSPVPDADRLPALAPGDDPLARHVDRIAERLNAIIYGWQDYAVVARR